MFLLMYIWYSNIVFPLQRVRPNKVCSKNSMRQEPHTLSTVVISSIFFSSISLRGWGPPVARLGSGSRMSGIGFGIGVRLPGLGRRRGPGTASGVRHRSSTVGVGVGVRVLGLGLLRLGFKG